MIYSLITVLLFSLSAFGGERTARYWGGQAGNLLRLLLATFILGGVALVWYGDTLHPVTFLWLFVSGMIGFGLGDISLFHAYVRIGARLTILLNLCTAPLWSVLIEWVWLGTRLTPGVLLAGLVIIVGVGLAVMCRAPRPAHRIGTRWAGILFALGAGWGQGVGAVISRKAYDIATAQGLPMNGISAAAQRVCGGLVLSLLIISLLVAAKKTRWPAFPVGISRTKAIGWLLFATLFGPVLGVSCFQWALAQQPAGIVTAIVATTPVAMIPLSVLIDREHPRPLSIAGAFVAVLGVVLLINVG